jgi:hypothetical protein
MAPVAMTSGPSGFSMSTEGMHPLTPLSPATSNAGSSQGVFPGSVPGPAGGGDITQFRPVTPPHLPDLYLLIGTWTRKRRDSGGVRLQRQYWARASLNVEIRAVDSYGRVLGHAWGQFTLSQGVLRERFKHATLTSRLEYIHRDDSTKYGLSTGRLILNGPPDGRDEYSTNWNG